MVLCIQKISHTYFLEIIWYIMPSQKQEMATTSSVCKALSSCKLEIHCKIQNRWDFWRAERKLNMILSSIFLLWLNWISWRVPDNQHACTRTAPQVRRYCAAADWSVHVSAGVETIIGFMSSLYWEKKTTQAGCSQRNFCIHNCVFISDYLFFVIVHKKKKKKSVMVMLWKSGKHGY